MHTSTHCFFSHTVSFTSSPPGHFVHAHRFDQCMLKTGNIFVLTMQKKAATCRPLRTPTGFHIFCYDSHLRPSTAASRLSETNTAPQCVT